MNDKKGIVLVLFLILLPIICVLFVLLIDGLNMRYIKVHTTGILEDILEKPEEVESILKLNNIEYKNYEFYNENGLNCISLEMEKQSIFGFIIDKDKFEIKANACKK